MVDVIDPYTTRLSRDPNWKLVLGSVGVVYGDIGTSPIYAFRQGLSATASGGSDPADVLGIVSLLLWTLILIVTLKYVVLILKADNDGEGGTLSLLALAENALGRRTIPIALLAVAGTALFFGDALITPAISVLSAVEGLKLVTPAFEAYVIPTAAVILIGLFYAQGFGTGRVAALFGPITAIWFLTIGLLGALHIYDSPAVLGALNPFIGLSYLTSHGLSALPIMAAVFLAVTGAEALYADMGHFGRGPIRVAWVSLVLPMLALSYVGQGAMVMADPTSASNPFFLMAPSWGLLPLVVLATVATVVASQAVISGAFSIAHQAMLLGLLPRMRVIHTSETQIGQIFIPRVNQIMLAGVLLLVLVFENSDSLASAYGIAVSGDMVITSVLVIVVFRLKLKWRLTSLACVFLPILAVETTFLSANLTKFAEGGYVTVTIAMMLGLAMWSWIRGREVVATKLKDSGDLETVARSLEGSERIARVPGTAVFLTPDAGGVPSALLHNVKHNAVLHERNFVVEVRIDRRPLVPDEERLVIEAITDRMSRVIMHFGYTEPANVPRALARARLLGFKYDIMSTSFFLHHRTFRPSSKSTLPKWQRNTFCAMARVAADAASFYHLPSDRVIELGQQVNV